MDNFQPPRLLITPKPERDEGLMGYVLRLTEANGYESPAWIFKLAALETAFSESGKYTLYLKEWDTSNLEYVTGLGREEIDRLWHRQTKKLNPHIPYVSADAVNLIRHKSLKVCPTCLEESNYCRSSWDIFPLTVCDVHGTLLMDRCPKCDNCISWVRKRVSVCPCGFDWRKAKTLKASPVGLEISRHILALLNESSEHGRIHKEERNPLHTLSLAELCQALTFIADSYLFLTRGQRISEITDNAKCHDAYCHAYNVFGNWPVNYRRFLEWVKRRQGRGIGKSEFTRRLFIKCGRRPLYFLLIATEDFIENDELSLRPASRLHLTSRRFIERSKAYLRLGAKQECVDRLITQGKLTIIDEWEGPRTFIDGESITEFLCFLRRLALIDDAACILNIDPPDIESLILEGCLKPASGPSVDGLPDWGFECHEISALLDKIRVRLPDVSSTSRKCLISTDEVFHLLKLHGISPGSFIRAIIEGEIAPRKEERYPCGLVFLFSKKSIKNYIRLHQERKIKRPKYVTAGATFLMRKKRQNDRVYIRNGKGKIFYDFLDLMYSIKSIIAHRSGY